MNFYNPERAYAHRRPPPCLVGYAIASVLALGVQASNLAGDYYRWEASLTAMDLNAAGVYLPLGAADPGDPTQMWTPMVVDIHLGQSAQPATKGTTFAYPTQTPSFTATVPGPITSPPKKGDLFFVHSFYEVYFDLTIKDTDPTVNFRGMSDGASLTLANLGPARLHSGGDQQPVPADPGLPNWGLVPPPEGAPYVGQLAIEAPLGVDLNGNGEDDKLKLSFMTLTVGGEDRVFIPLEDGSIREMLNLAVDLTGYIADQSEDPPFYLNLSGPTTGTAKLVPEPGSYGLLAGLGLVAFAVARRLRQ